jgi:hypothetical protein
MRSRETTKTRRRSSAELCCVWEEMTSRSRSKGGVSDWILGREHRGRDRKCIYTRRILRSVELPWLDVLFVGLFLAWRMDFSC